MLYVWYLRKAIVIFKEEKQANNIEICETFACLAVRSKTPS